MACDAFQIPSPDPLVIRLPGGATITGVVQGATPSDLDVVRAISGQVAALLGPYQAVFDLVATIQLVLDTIKSIPRAIATLSPGLITEKLDELTAKLASLASLLPAVAIPRLAKDVIELVARNNDALRTVITSITTQQTGSAGIEALASTLDPDFPDAAAALRASGDCLTTQVTSRMGALSAGQGPLDQLITLINTLLGLVPGIPIPPLPTVGNLPADPADALVVLDSVDTALGPIRAALSGI